MTNPNMLKSFMDDYINTTVKEIGEVYAWDVINEIFSNSGQPKNMDHYPYNNSVFYEIGDPEDKTTSWACNAFKTAKNANPKIKMFYNDDMISSMAGKYERKSDETYNLMKFLVDNDCGIDGVGFESHVDINFADENFTSIKKDIQRYAAIGLEVMFTEIDVRCNRKVGGKCSWGDGEWPQDMLEKQAHVFQGLL